MTRSGILPLLFPIISQVWAIDGFRAIFWWWIHSIRDGICNLLFLNGENALISFGVLLQNPRLPIFLCVFPSKVFPWGLGSSILGFQTSNALFVGNYCLSCIFFGFVGIPKIIGTRFMIFSSHSNLNPFLGTWLCRVIPPESLRNSPKFGILSRWKFCFSVER